ncbi:MAG TPA: hypothetical protein VK974_03195 [Methylophilaceae bacterium]|nr:hypothetical protein [Methylophilaceae bacterium]
MRKSPWIFVVLPLLPLVLLLLFFGSRYLNEPSTIPVEFIQCSNIVEGCGQQSFNIRFDQVPQVMKPFKVSIEASGAEQAHVSFAMQGMEMGLNRYRLIKQADSTWQAEVTLPVCVQGRSYWAALIELKTTNGLKRYQIEFDAIRQ